MRCRDAAAGAQPPRGSAASPAAARARQRGTGFGLLIAVALLVCRPLPASAQAESSVRAEHKAMAQTLFREGNELMQQAQHEAACAKFAASQRLDPAMGTAYNLGRCYEVTGKLASAWAMFRASEALARQNRDADRERFAREAAQALDPKLARLVVTVPAPSRLAGLQVQRNGMPIEAAGWGTPLPVDPGEQRIEVSAPGYKLWRRTLVVAPEPKTNAVNVPQLEPLPVLARGPRPAPTRTRAAVGLAAVGFGVGAAGLLVGTIAGAVAMNKRDALRNQCPTAGCTQVDIDRVATGAHVSTAGFVIGGVGTALGVIGIALPKARVTGARGSYRLGATSAIRIDW